MIIKRKIEHEVEIDITVDDAIELLMHSGLSHVEAADKLLSTFTWHDARSREGKMEILKMLDIVI